MQTSSDLRLLVLYSTDGFEVRDGLVVPHELAPIEPLIEQARGSTDPLLLDLLVRHCGLYRMPRRCDPLPLARRWVEADTQNQLAWLTLAVALRERGDLDGGRQAFVRAASASMWREHERDVARLIFEASLTDAGIRERNFAAQSAFAKAGLFSGIEALQLVNIHCKEPALRDVCLRIVTVVQRDSRNAMGASIAAVFAAKLGEDPTIVARYQRTIDAMYWAAVRMNEKVDPVVGFDWETAVRTDELQRLQLFLLQEGISEDEAARRYVAGLSRQQVAMRNEVRKPYPRN